MGTKLIHVSLFGLLCTYMFVSDPFVAWVQRNETSMSMHVWLTMPLGLTFFISWHTFSNVFHFAKVTNKHVASFTCVCVFSIMLRLLAHLPLVPLRILLIHAERDLVFLMSGIVLEMTLRTLKLRSYTILHSS